MARWHLAAAMAVLMLCGGAANASPLGSAFTALQGAAETRATAATGTEAKKLTAASVALAKVSVETDGKIDATDASALALAVRALGQSKTQDAGVLAAAATLAQCLVDYVRADEDAILRQVQGIFASATRAKFQAKLDAVETTVQKVAGLAGTNPLQALSTAQSAVNAQAGVSKKVTAIYNRLLGAGVLYRHSSDLVLNPTSKTIRILRVEVNVDVVPETSAPFNLQGDVTGKVPAGSSYRLPYDLLPDRFFDYDNALGYAISDRIGFEFANYTGAVRLILKGHPPVDLPVSR